MSQLLSSSVRGPQEEIQGTLTALRDVLSLGWARAEGSRQATELADRAGYLQRSVKYFPELTKPCEK